MTSLSLIAFLSYKKTNSFNCPHPV